MTKVIVSYFALVTKEIEIDDNLVECVKDKYSDEIIMQATNKKDLWAEVQKSDANYRIPISANYKNKEGKNRTLYHSM